MFGGLSFPAGCQKERALSYDPSAEMQANAFQNSGPRFIFLTQSFVRRATAPKKLRR
jgi:hypothetical protein